MGASKASHIKHARSLRALEMHRAGMTNREIGKELGVSATWAGSLVKHGSRAEAVNAAGGIDADWDRRVAERRQANTEHAAMVKAREVARRQKLFEDRRPETVLLYAGRDGSAVTAKYCDLSRDEQDKLQRAFRLPGMIQSHFHPDALVDLVWLASLPH